LPLPSTISTCTSVISSVPRGRFGTMAVKAGHGVCGYHGQVRLTSSRGVRKAGTRTRPASMSTVALRMPAGDNAQPVTVSFPLTSLPSRG